MNVLHLIDSQGLYGAEHVLLNLLPSLQSCAINSTLGCMSSISSPGADVGKELIKLGTPVIFLNETRKVSIKGLIAIYKAIKKTRADIIHVHGYKATILGGLISHLMRIPFLVTYHGEAKQRPELSNYIRIETFILRYAKHVIAVSSNIRSELIDRGIRENMTSVIYNGIKDPLLNVSKVNSKTSDQSVHLLCIGRLVLLKRYDIIIDSVNMLRHDFPNIIVSIAGSGPLTDILKHKANELDLNSHIKFLGHISETDGLYHKADIFLICSDTEGSPVTLIEAMAFSLPIIATSVGAIPEMVQNGVNAILVPPNDVKMITESIRLLITNPDLSRSLGKAARMRYLERFTSDVMAHAYFQRYNSVKN